MAAVKLIVSCRTHLILAFVIRVAHLVVFVVVLLYLGQTLAANTFKPSGFSYCILDGDIISRHECAHEHKEETVRDRAQRVALRRLQVLMHLEMLFSATGLRSPSFAAYSGSTPFLRRPPVLEACTPISLRRSHVLLTTGFSVVRSPRNFFSAFPAKIAQRYAIHLHLINKYSMRASKCGLAYFLAMSRRRAYLFFLPMTWSQGWYWFSQTGTLIGKRISGDCRQCRSASVAEL